MLRLKKLLEVAEALLLVEAKVQVSFKVDGAQLKDFEKDLKGQGYELAIPVEQVLANLAAQLAGSAGSEVLYGGLRDANDASGLRVLGLKDTEEPEEEEARTSRLTRVLAESARMLAEGRYAVTMDTAWSQGGFKSFKRELEDEGYKVLLPIEQVIINLAADMLGTDSEEELYSGLENMDPEEVEELGLKRTEEPEKPIKTSKKAVKVFVRDDSKAPLIEYDWNTAGIREILKRKHRIVIGRSLDLDIMEKLTLTAGVQLGDGVQIGGIVDLGLNVRIGKETDVYSKSGLIVEANAIIGNGVKLLARTVEANVRIADDCHIGYGTVIREDVVLEKGVFLDNNSLIARNMRLKAYVMIGKQGSTGGVQLLGGENKTIPANTWIDSQAAWKVFLAGPEAWKAYRKAHPID